MGSGSGACLLLSPVFHNLLKNKLAFVSIESVGKYSCKTPILIANAVMTNKEVRIS